MPLRPEAGWQGEVPQAEMSPPVQKEGPEAETHLEGGYPTRKCSYQGRDHTPRALTHYYTKIAHIPPLSTDSLFNDLGQ